MDFSTGGSGSGGTSPPPSGGISSSGGGPEFSLSDPVGSFIATVRGVLLSPAAFFRGMRRSGDFVGPLVFAVICYEIFLVISGVIALVFGSAITALDSLQQAGVQAGVSLISFIVGLILWPIFAVVALFIMAGIRHLLVIALAGPNQAGFEATLRVNSYAAATRLIWWIPILGPIVGFIYGLVLYTIGIREVHATTTGKAALIVLIPWIVLGFFILIVGIIAGFAIFSAIQQQGL